MRYAAAIVIFAAAVGMGSTAALGQEVAELPKVSANLIGEAILRPWR